jgi:hypothetical protein
MCGSDEFVCDRFQAAFVSSRVAKLMLNDPSIDEYLIAGTDSKVLTILCELICCESVSINDENADLFLGLIECIENVELNEFVVDFVDENDELNVSNCISRLMRRLRFEVGIERERCFIGTHICEIEIESLRRLDFNVMSDILKSESLRVESEDWLIDLIFSLGPLHYKLLGDVRFEYLSCRGIDIFFEKISVDCLDDRILQQLWNRSRHRIVYDPTDIPYNGTRYIGFVSRRPSSPWSGLISHLSDLCGGNVHTKGIVAVSCSSTSQNQCWDVVNYDWNDYWYSVNFPNSWIQFDFKDRFVSITDYALKSDGNIGYHLQEWAIQGSMDGFSWTDLDRRNTQELNDNYITKVYSCNVTFSESHFYRFIRLVQTGKNSSGNDYLMLGNFECFGSMAKAPPFEVVPQGNPPDS